MPRLDAAVTQHAGPEASRAPLEVAISTALGSPVDASEHALFDVLRTSISKLAPQIDAAAIDRQGRIPPELLDSLRRAGLFALSIGEAHGGLGLSLRTCCAVIDELARLDRSVAVMVGLHAGLGTAGLNRYGQPEQQARFLPRLATGEDIASFAATEPGAGSDLMAISTTATVVPEGLRITGEKAYVTNGGLAGVYTLLVRTPELGGPRAQSMVCIRRDTPGLVVGAEEDKLGIRGSSTVSLHLDDVIVARDAIVGTPGRGSEQADHVLAWGRTLMSSGCLGTARTALTLSLAHVTTRKQFGKKLAELPLVKADCVQMAALIYAMEALVRMTALAEHDSARLSRLSTMAKVFCSESTFTICDRAIQLHGALGFLETSGLPRLARDCRVTRIFEGANDVLCVRTGAALLAGKPESPAVTWAMLVPAQLADSAALLDGVLAEQAATHALLRARFGVSVMQQQAVLWSVGKAEAWLSAALASLLRASAARDPESIELGDHAVRSLVEQAAVLLHRARDVQAADRQARIARLSEPLFAPLSSSLVPSTRGTRSKEVVP